MSGIDSKDGQGTVIMVGPGCTPGYHYLVPLISDNEFGLIVCKSIRKQPGMQVPSCYNSQKAVFLIPGSLFGGIRGYSLMTRLLDLY
jgi:hypothetical protein